MRQRLIPIIITLALLLPGLVAGSWVGYYYVHQKHTAPYSPQKHTFLLQVPTPRARRFLRLGTKPALSPVVDVRLSGYG